MKKIKTKKSIGIKPTINQEIQTETNIRTVVKKPAKSREDFLESSGESLEKESYSQFPLTRLNFILMAIAGFVIILGFILMTGGSSSAEKFNPDIFSTRRIVVGPTIAFLGFVFMGFAIMWRKTDNTKEEQEVTSSDKQA